ncbi:hypothetical protein RFI_21445, partial [Reticulomyxa filosa]
INAMSNAKENNLDNAEQTAKLSGTDTDQKVNFEFGSINFEDLDLTTENVDLTVVDGLLKQFQDNKVVRDALEKNVNGCIIVPIVFGLPVKHRMIKKLARYYEQHQIGSIIDTAEILLDLKNINQDKPEENKENKENENDDSEASAKRLRTNRYAQYISSLLIAFNNSLPDLLTKHVNEALEIWSRKNPRGSRYCGSHIFLILIITLLYWLHLIVTGKKNNETTFSLEAKIISKYETNLFVFSVIDYSVIVLFFSNWIIVVLLLLDSILFQNSDTILH